MEDPDTAWLELQARHAAEDAEEEKRLVARREQRRQEDEERLVNQRKQAMFFEDIPAPHAETASNSQEVYGTLMCFDAI